MTDIAKGALIKEWFIATPQVRRLLTHKGQKLHILNLDEIEDDAFYAVSLTNRTETTIHKINILEKIEDFDF